MYRNFASTQIPVDDVPSCASYTEQQCINFEVRRSSWSSFVTPNLQLSSNTTELDFRLETASSAACGCSKMLVAAPLSYTGQPRHAAPRPHNFSSSL